MSFHNLVIFSVLLLLNVSFGGGMLGWMLFFNTVVLGSFVSWLALTIPIFFAARYGVAKYRATIGERVRRGRWAVGSNKVSWLADSAGRGLNDIERLVLRVVSGLNDLQVVAELSGSIAAPKFSVSSNLDKAIAQRIQAVLGEEVAKAEKRVRAKVDTASWPTRSSR